MVDSGIQCVASCMPGNGRYDQTICYHHTMDYIKMLTIARHKHVQSSNCLLAVIVSLYLIIVKKELDNSYLLDVSQNNCIRRFLI